MQHIYDGFRVNRQPCQCVCTPKICRMPHKSLIIGWTLLILPPGDFEDLYRVSNPKTSGTPERNRTSAPWVRAKCTTVIRQGYLVLWVRVSVKPRVSTAWQPWLGSNQQRRSQSPACYHYTTGLYTRHINHSFDLPIDQYAKSCIIGFEPIT